MATRDKRISLTHIVGFFDGEGTVHAASQKTKKNGKRHFSIQVFFTNTDLAKLERIQASYGGHIRRMKKRPHEKPLYRLEWWGEKADALLRLFLNDPDFSTKRRQAELAVAMRELKQKYIREYGHPSNKGYPQWLVDQLARYKAEISFLNQKGVLAVAETKPLPSQVTLLASGSDSPTTGESQ